LRKTLLLTVLRDGGSHRRCPSATQHVTPPAAVPIRGSADDGREGKDEQPLLPSITGGTLCASNGPLQNPQSEALLIKNKPKNHAPQNQRNQKPGVVWTSGPSMFPHMWDLKFERLRPWSHCCPLLLPTDVVWFFVVDVIRPASLNPPGSEEQVRQAVCLFLMRCLIKG
jgi:hypothetical protein